MLFKTRKNILGNKSISVIRLQLSDVAQLDHTKEGKRKEPSHLDVGNINEEERRLLCLLPSCPEPG